MIIKIFTNDCIIFDHNHNKNQCAINNELNKKISFLLLNVNLLKYCAQKN